MTYDYSDYLSDAMADVQPWITCEIGKCTEEFTDRDSYADHLDEVHGLEWDKALRKANGYEAPEKYQPGDR